MNYSNLCTILVLYFVLFMDIDRGTAAVLGAIFLSGHLSDLGAFIVRNFSKQERDGEKYVSVVLGFSARAIGLLSGLLIGAPLGAHLYDFFLGDSPRMLSYIARFI